MRELFDPSSPVLIPSELVQDFTGKKEPDLRLPRRAVVAFDAATVSALLRGRSSGAVEAWKPFRILHRLEGTETVVTRCYYGGPNMAALVEELSAFGVREFCMFGYAGAITGGLAIGDVIVATAALREEGVSYHYLPEDEGLVGSAWATEWAARGEGFRVGPVWTSDAIYRETRDKVERYEAQGLLAVEMEVAALYAVCRARGLAAVAFLVVSDLLAEDRWVPGFRLPVFRAGVKRLAAYFREQVIV